jgi:hypothetical protein
MLRACGIGRGSELSRSCGLFFGLEESHQRPIVHTSGRASFFENRLHV